MPRHLLSLLLAATLAAHCGPTAAQSLLVGSGSERKLSVDGRPFIILGGELGNSSASSETDAARIFPKLARMGLNTVLVPAYWDLMEPVEGEFDFSLTDAAVRHARANGLKIVFLWFGAWKNSMSCYAPEWFKRDSRRFPRAHTESGKPLEIASAFSDNVFKADSRAFEALAGHIAKTDTAHTVIMLQVENEIGMLENARDYSADATRLYRSAVPERLTDYLTKNRATLHPDLRARWEANGARTNGTWEQLFGPDEYGEEVFMAWHYALYVGKMADAARRHTSMPLYVNAAMNSRGRRPGQYPSAGPLAHLIDIWRCGAPAVDFISPDIYDPGFASWASRYATCGNALFIPEMRLSDDNGAQAFYAIGEHRAIGVSPFSIENGSEAGKLGKAYDALRKLTPILSGDYGRHGMLFETAEQEQAWTEDGLRIAARHFFTLPWDSRATDGSTWPAAGAVLIRLAPMEYILAGTGVVLTFQGEDEVTADAKAQAALGEDGFAANGAEGREAKTPRWTAKSRVGIASVDEVEPQADGTLRRVRRLNGDEDHQGRHVRIGVDGFQILHVKLYKYK